MPAPRRTGSRRPGSLAAGAALASVLLAAPLTALAAGSAAADDVPLPVTTTREVVGTSVRGLPMTVIHRTTEGATRRVLVIGSIHGDEQAGMRVVRALRDRVDLPDQLDLWLAPTVNPDGTAADRRTNAHGVDLNRNFPYNWHTSSRGETWSGPRPLSEPESVALRDLVRRVDPWLVITFHQPLFGVGVNDKGYRTVRAIAEGMRLPLEDYVCSGACYGTFTQWVNNRTDGLAVTVEFGDGRVRDWRIRAAARTVVDVGAGG